MLNKMNRARSQIQMQISDDSSGSQNIDRTSNVSCTAKIQTVTKFEDNKNIDKKTRDFTKKSKPLTSDIGKTEGNIKQSKNLSLIKSVKGKKEKKLDQEVIQAEKTNVEVPKQVE